MFINFYTKIKFYLVHAFLMFVNKNRWYCHKYGNNF